MNDESLNTLQTASTDHDQAERSQVIVVVEGTNDIELLKRFSTILHAEDSAVRDLTQLESDHQVVFLPIGGGNVRHWERRLGPLGCTEFHLYDRELPPESAIRERAASLVNRRAGCQAAITSKRSLENYLHATAIELAGGPEIIFGDGDCVPEILAKKRHRLSYIAPWEHVPRHQRRKLVHKAKQWLCREAASQMSPELIRRRDRVMAGGNRRDVDTQWLGAASSKPPFQGDLMQLADRLAEHVRACFTGLWIQSHEHDEAIVEISRLCHDEKWRLAAWDIDRGLQLPGQNTASTDTGASDPLAAIRALNTLATSDGTAILVLANFHRFLGSAEIVQALARQIAVGKQNRTFIVVLSPIVQVPPELEKLFVILDHELPNREQIQEIARGVATEAGELPTGDAFTSVIDAAAGLTRYEAEAAFSLSLVRHGRLEPGVLWELKSQMLKKSGLLSLHRGSESFADLGGLDNLKAFCLRAMRRQATGNKSVRPKGVLLLSPPGCGKSQFCKALGNETGRPTLTLDVGSLLGSLVGQSEQNIRQALKIVDAMAPCVLFCDELEKSLSGVAASGQTDSGVSARLFGNLLTWLNDHESDVFFVGTCNGISKLPPEFARAERFDGVFFVDLPDSKQREAIWRIYIELFGLDARQNKPDDRNWTGAEIRSCCRLAALLDVPLVQASQNVVPVAVTAGESVEKLRTWATGRCLSADRPGIFERSGHGNRTARRRISRDPSNN